jgi:predicted nucleotidyltransferase
VFDLFDELGAIIDTLESRGIEYALCGGLAVSVHGFARATDDIDLFVPAQSVQPIKDAVAALGYTFVAHPMRFSDGAMLIERVSKIDRVDGDVMTLDLLVMTPRSEHVWTSRTQLEWRGRPISVVSREGLIALKRFRMSKLDIADIEKLEASES